MARRLVLRKNVGERLLSAKLQILNGSGPRRPSMALSILTGRMAEQLTILENFYGADPAVTEPTPLLPVEENVASKAKAQYVARTVYLSETHMRDIDSIIETLTAQPFESKRLTRSAIVRQALEHLRTSVEADPACLKFMLESEF